MLTTLGLALPYLHQQYWLYCGPSEVQGLLSWALQLVRERSSSLALMRVNALWTELFGSIILGRCFLRSSFLSCTDYDDTLCGRPAFVRSEYKEKRFMSKRRSGRLLFSIIRCPHASLILATLDFLKHDTNNPLCSKTKEIYFMSHKV